VADCLGVVCSSGSSTLALGSEEGKGFWSDYSLSEVRELILFATYPVHGRFRHGSISNHEIYILSSQGRVDHSTPGSDWTLNNVAVIVWLYAPRRRIGDSRGAMPVVLALPNAAKDDIF
jgi:hypothetical protein